MTREKIHTPQQNCENLTKFTLVFHPCYDSTLCSDFALRKDFFKVIYLPFPSQHLTQERVHNRPVIVGHESEQTPGDSEGQGSLACCSPWVRRVGPDSAGEQL